MNRLSACCVALLVTLAATVPLDSASAATAAQISRDSRSALRRLYANNRSARILGERAKAVLIFPTIVKAGFIIGGQGGEGALIENGKVVAFYNTAAASYGLQAGVQRFGYALFFMTDEALGYLRKSEGWEIGTGPSVVLVDKGMARNISSTTLQEGVYAFVFKQQGLMAGVGIQGSKITRIHPR
jgi:lipid-binding SYLF domain-containing protein